MRILALLLALVCGLVVSLLIKAEVDFRYRRQDEKDHVEIDLRALHGLWKFKFEIPTVQLSWEQGPELSVEQEAHSASGQTKTAGKARFRFWYGSFFLRIWPRLHIIFHHFQEVKARFYRAIHCKSLDWKIEIGLQDPAKTAIAAGAFWALLSISLTRLYKQITMEVPKPSLSVIPQFQSPGFSCDIHCIFQLRIGHLIFAGINLLRTVRMGLRG